MSLRRFLLPAAVLSLSACGAGEDGPPPAEAPPYEALQVETNFMLPMRDGVRLATDVFRPARGGTPVDERFPALLHRTPYDKASPRLAEQARYFAGHGYVVVLQDLRGLYFSEGVFAKYHDHDAPDGFDTIRWITDLDYTEPSVGMWGTSYGAHTQADAAKLNPPGLRALVLTMGGLSDAWTHKVRNHGAFELGQQLGWAHSQLAAVTDEPSIRRRLEAAATSDWFPLTPFRKGEGPLSGAPNFEDYYLEMQNHGDYDDYFRGIGRNWVEYYEQTADIPMLHVGGWYDSYAPGTIQSFVELSRLKSSPMTLVMGPWTHGGYSRSYAGDIEFGAAAAIPDFAREFHRRWFDRHLKGRADLGLFADPDRPGGAPDDPVAIFVMGGGDGRRGRRRPSLPRRQVGRRPFLAARRGRGDGLPPARRRRTHPRGPGGGGRARAGIATTPNIRCPRSAALSPGLSSAAATTSGNGVSGRSKEVRRTAFSGRKWTAAVPPTARMCWSSRPSRWRRMWR